MDASVSFLNGNTNRKETCLNRQNNNKYARLNKNTASRSLTYEESNLSNFKHLPNNSLNNTTHHNHHHHLHQQQQHRHQIYARIPSSSTSANSPGKKSIQANNQLNDLHIFERSINADTNNNNNHNAGNSTSKSSMQINEQQQHFNNMMMKMMIKGKNKIPESNHCEYDNFEQQSTCQAEQQPSK